MSPLTRVARRLSKNIALHSPYVSNAPRSRVCTRQASSYLNDDVSETAILPGDRKIGFARFGARAGHTVFYLHGGEGSRLEARLHDSYTSKLGATIIAVDRPGIGLSSPQPNRTVSDHAKDITDLANYLGCEQYSVIGISAGGSYALACARFHDRSRLKGVALVAGIQPYHLGLKGMALSNMFTYLAFRYAPRLWTLVSRPALEADLKRSDDELVEASLTELKSRFQLSKVPEKDREVYSNPHVLQIFTASFREHFRQGFDAWMEDGRLLSIDWGFRLEDIDFSPIKLWYAIHDVNIATCTGPELKRILGDRAELHMEDESHVSLELNCGEKILADLLRDA